LGSLFAVQYNMDNFQEKMNMTFFHEEMDIEDSNLERLKVGKTVMVTLFNPSTTRSEIMSMIVPNDQIQSILFILY